MTGDFWQIEPYDEAYDSAKKHYDADVKSAIATATRPFVQQAAEEEWQKATGTLAEDTARSFLNTAYKAEYDAEVAGITQRAISPFLSIPDEPDPNVITEPLPAQFPRTPEPEPQGPHLPPGMGNVAGPPSYVPPPAPDPFGRTQGAATFGEQDDTRVGLPEAPLTTREADVAAGPPIGPQTEARLGQFLGEQSQAGEEFERTRGMRAVQQAGIERLQTPEGRAAAETELQAGIKGVEDTFGKIGQRITGEAATAASAGAERAAAGDIGGAVAGYAGAAAQGAAGLFGAPGAYVSEAAQLQGAPEQQAEIAGALANFATPFGGAGTLAVMDRMGKLGKLAVSAMGMTGGAVGGKLAYDQAKAEGKSDEEAWQAAAVGVVNGADAGLGIGEIGRLGALGVKAVAPKVGEGVDALSRAGEQMPEARLGAVAGDTAGVRAGEAAIQRFGVTDAAEDAGYLLPNGRYVNMRGADGGTHVEHGAVSQFYPDAGSEGAAIGAFQRETGAARFRLDPDVSVDIDTSQPLTAGQKAAVGRLLRDAETPLALNVEYRDPTSGELRGFVQLESATSIREVDDALQRAMRGEGVAGDTQSGIVSGAGEGTARRSPTAEDAALLERLHNSPVRQRGFAASPEAAVERYLEDLRTLVSRVAPDHLDTVDEAIEDFLAGDLSSALVKGEDALMRGHDEFYEQGRAATAAREVIDLPERLRNALPNAEPSTSRRLRSVFESASRPALGAAARTTGERAFDLGTGAATGGVSAERERQAGGSPLEVAGAGLTGFAAGTLGGAAARGLRRNVGALRAGDGVSGAIRGATPADVDAAWQKTRTALATPAKTPLAATSLEQVAKNANIEAKLFDTGAPLRRVQDEVYRRLGRAPTEEEDAALMLRLYAGRGAAAAQRVDSELMPAIKELSKQEREGLNEFLSLADSADRAESIGRQVEREALKAGATPAAAAAKGQKAAESRLFSGGVKALKLGDVVDGLGRQYGDPTAARILNAADQVWGFARSLRERLHAAGVISDDVFQAWERDYPRYVPTKIIDYMEQGGKAPVATGRPLLTVSDLGIKKLTVEGTSRAREKPVNSVIRAAFATESLARRNEGAQAILKMMDNSPELKGLVKKAPSDHTLTKDEAFFSAYVDGKQQRYVVPKTLEGLFRFSGPTIEEGWRLAGALMGSGVLKAGATGVNLAFIPMNALRDAQEFMRRTGGFSSGKKFAKNGAELARAFYDSFTKGGGADWEQALKTGAGQANPYQGLETDALMRRLTKEGRLGGMVRPVKSKTDFVLAIGDAMSGVFEPVRVLGENVERAPRLAAYRLAKAAGKSERQAGLAARDITMDFQRKGSLTAVADVLLPYLNVGFQGVERFFTYDFAKGRRAQSAIGIVSSVILPTMAVEAYNRGLYPEDWASVPDYLKDTGFVVLLPVDPKPNTDGTPGQRPYLWIPRPQSVNFFSALTAKFMEEAYGDDSRQWSDTLGALLGMASPVGLDAPPAPPLIRTGFELATNRDTFRGRDIVPRNVLNLPEGEQAAPSTSSVGRAIGGAIDKPPAAVDYFATSLGSGVARQGLRVADSLARPAGIPASEPAKTTPILDVPVAGDIVGGVLRNRGGQVVQDEVAALDRRQKRVLAEKLAELRASNHYKAATPQQRQAWERGRANAIDADFDKARKAIWNRARSVASR